MSREFRELMIVEAKGFRQTRAASREWGNKGKTSWGGKFRLRRALSRTGQRNAGLRQGPKRPRKPKKVSRAEGIARDGVGWVMPMNSAYRNTSS